MTSESPQKAPALSEVRAFSTSLNVEEDVPEREHDVLFGGGFGPVGKYESAASAESQGSAERVRARRLSVMRVAPERKLPAVSHMSFVLSVGNARVALHARRDGNKLIVIAVCSSRHSEFVRRALAEAAMAMRSRGECLDASVRAVMGEVSA